MVILMLVFLCFRFVVGHSYIFHRGFVRLTCVICVGTLIGLEDLARNEHCMWLEPCSGWGEG